MVEYRQERLSRGEAVEVMSAVDDAGVSCSLTVELLPNDGRRYSVLVALDGMDVDLLNDVHQAVKTVPSALATVEGSYLVIR